MEASQFTLYSLGIAASNKALGSDQLEVYPAEVTPFVDGELKANPQEVETSGSAGEGKQFNVKVTEDNVVVASWLRHGQTNRRTPPDVRRGERVEIWRHGDSGNFFWQSRGMDDHLRKLETVIFSFSATKDEAVNSTEPDNAYSLEVCTHTKQITLRTVKADGEPFAYTFQFNTGQGKVTLTDDVGNYVQLDSAETLIRMFNITGTFVELNKENINAYAPQNIDGKADQNIALEAGQNMSLKAGQNISEEAGQNVSIKAGATASVEGGSSAILKSGGTTITLTPGGGTFQGIYDVV